MVTGREEEGFLTRPVPHRSYSEAVAALDRPRLFENRPSYRLLDAGWPSRLDFGLGRYFDVIDVCEASTGATRAAWPAAAACTR